MFAIVSGMRAKTEQSNLVARHGFVKPRWWHEVFLSVVFYVVYSVVRNQFGSALGPSMRRQAYENALDIIALERSLRLYFEQQVQQFFLDLEWFIIFWNVFYGSFHFLVTIFVMVWLFLRVPQRYVFMRSTLAITTTTALIGFAVYPLMPPRLLSNCVSKYGDCSPGHNYVDTLVEYGALWSFESGTMEAISNQYAAMPSLHIAWALWATISLVPVLQKRSTRLIMLAYPLLTLFSIVVTANHFWIDAVGGIAIVALGFILAPLVTPLLPGGKTLKHIKNIKHIATQLR